jgi:hypothetical protein
MNSEICLVDSAVLIHIVATGYGNQVVLVLEFWRKHGKQYVLQIFLEIFISAWEMQADTLVQCKASMLRYLDI